MGLDTSLITQSLTSQMNWVARRPKNSSLNVDSVKALFRERSLRLSEALRELRSELSSKIVINIS
jgi:dTDP-4-dehydrorhamnose reductase